MKKYIIPILTAFLLPSLVFAAYPASWYFMTTSSSEIIPNRVNGVQPSIRAISFTATSTTATSTFAGSVGIGTTTPTASLTINNNVAKSATIKFTNGGYFEVGNTDDGAPSASDMTGAKLVFYNSGNSASSYAIGEENNAMWFNVINSAAKYKWYNGGNLKMILDGSGNLGVGTTSPYGLFSVQGSTDIPQLILKMTSGQTNAIQEWYDSTGTRLGRIDNAGQVIVGAGATVIGSGVVKTTQISDTSGAANIYLKSTGNIGVGTTSPTNKLEVNGDIFASGFVTQKESGGFAYLSPASSTSMASANTYYAVNGTFVNAPMFDFVATSTPGIQYTGTTTTYYEIHMASAISCDTPSDTISIGVKLNGVFATSSKTTTLCKTAGDIYNITGFVVLSLAKNDVIQLVIASDKTGSTCTFQTYQTTIKRFF